MRDDIGQLRGALAEMRNRARADKRFLDLGVLEATIAALDDWQPPPAVASLEPKPKRGRPSKSKEGNGVPGSVADLA